MKKLLTILVLSGILGGQLADAQVADTARVDSSPRPSISEIRQRNAQKFARKQDSPEKAVTISQGCLPCDTRTVGQLLNREEKLTREDIRQFLCTYRPECQDNVEYMPMLNELVHKVIQNSPDAFFEEFSSTEGSPYRDMLEQILSNPGVDSISTTKVLNIVQKRLDQSRTLKRNDEIPLVEHLRATLQQAIEKENQERVLRGGRR